MPSVALQGWRNDRSVALDELEAAHRGIGGTRRGRRYATQQINQAYAVLLSSQFQGFCREFHTECADFLIQSVPVGLLKGALRNALLHNRTLDRGNPNPGNIGADFNRFGLFFWDEVGRLDARNPGRRERLRELNEWRNAIAHHDFNHAILGRTILRLQSVRDWRRACHLLADSFDEVMRSHLHRINGVSPW